MRSCRGVWHLNTVNSFSLVFRCVKEPESVGTWTCLWAFDRFRCLFVFHCPNKINRKLKKILTLNPKHHSLADWRRDTVGCYAQIGAHVNPADTCYVQRFTIHHVHWKWPKKTINLSKNPFTGKWRKGLKKWNAVSENKGNTNLYMTVDNNVLTDRHTDSKEANEWASFVLMSRFGVMYRIRDIQVSIFHS